MIEIKLVETEIIEIEFVQTEMIEIELSRTIFNKLIKRFTCST